MPSAEAVLSEAPAGDEYGTYHTRYVSLVPSGHVLVTLAAQLEETLAILRGVSEADAERKQPPYQWSIKEVVGHMTDTERVFAYRAMRFAREDPTPLPSFDQDDYVRAARFDRRPLAELLTEFATTRHASLSLLRGLDPEALLRRGTASGILVSVRAIAHILAGHERHHARILRERVAALATG
ncbi:MAG: DinB family protein [Isosphaeraceae bacterium]